MVCYGQFFHERKWILGRKGLTENFPFVFEEIDEEEEVGQRVWDFQEI